MFANILLTQIPSILKFSSTLRFSSSPEFIALPVFSVLFVDIDDLEKQQIPEKSSHYVSPLIFISHVRIHTLFHVKQRSDKLKPVRTITYESRKTQSVCGLSEWKHIKDNSRRWNVRLLPSSIKQRLRKTETIFVIPKEEQKWQRIVFKAYDIYALNSLSQRSRNAAILTPSQKYFHTAYSVSVTDGKLNLSISRETYRSITTQSRISLNMNSPPL